MSFPEDIYTEPEPDPDTLANLGPLRPWPARGSAPAVTVSSDDEWSYHQDTVLEVRGTSGPFHHTDRNTLTRVAPPVPNPMAQAT